MNNKNTDLVIGLLVGIISGIISNYIFLGIQKLPETESRK